jgi:hypothetical protein
MSENTTPVAPQDNLARQVGRLVGQLRRSGRRRRLLLAVAVVAAVVVVVVGLWLWHRPSAGPEPVGPAQAAALVGQPKEVRLTFVVRSAGRSRSGKLVFLNDQQDYRAAGVFTVVIDTEAVPQFASVEPRSIVGKTVEATGLVTEYRGRPQLMVRDATRLTLR